MMDYLATNWGDVATVIGIIVSLVGLGWAIKEAHGAKSASQAAQVAAYETRDQVARHLQAVDLQRAIGLIERIKTLHDSESWEAARQHYQTLRRMLSDVIVRCPGEQREEREKLSTARAYVSEMDNSVRLHSSGGVSNRDKSLFNRVLNDIQSDLEELASKMGFGESQGEAT